MVDRFSASKSEEPGTRTIEEKLEPWADSLRESTPWRERQVACLEAGAIWGWDEANFADHQDLLNSFPFLAEIQEVVEEEGL